MSETRDAQPSYSDSVHLPKTDFPMRGDLPAREPLQLKIWEENKVFARMLEKAADRPVFSLHDGPPYANGNIHIGHALNKTLKDIVVKSQSLLGRRTPFVPGWDCHGLPIEHALLKEKKMSKRGVSDILSFRREAQAFAERWIATQMAEFRRLGVFASWEKPYKTMSPEYEAGILRAFRKLYEKGCIYRGKKTVSWCVTCETALAEAEVEYKPKSSPSVLVALPIVRSKLPFALGKDSVLIWTTTPWTLPANLAVAFHPALQYVLAEFHLPSGKRTLLVARERESAVSKMLGAKGHEAIGSWWGKELVDSGLVCQTPFGHIKEFSHKESKAVAALYVSSQDGTGIVHTAPGHGADDYFTGVKEGLEILCPVDSAGRYDATLAGTGLEGLHIFEEGNPAVIERLKADKKLLYADKVEHSYQHCWRCKNPIAFRATEQWFLSVTHDGLRERLLKAVDAVKWVPAVGRERISSMVAQRPDWCLSRQRLWGTPIPVFKCSGCGKVQADSDLLEAVEKKTAADGSDFWFDKISEPVRLGQGAWAFAPKKTCACGGGEFFRETDILDVWMDSGASWLSVLGEDQVPCDLYLEGSDQHRGWFQSSLVMSAAINGGAPYKTVLTHGFVLDDKGRAMHKSLGNVVAPQTVYDKLGADVLRLWTALADYSDDVRLSDKLLQGPTDTYRKLRNSFRYLLGNICDFDPAKDFVRYEKMPELERLVLLRLALMDDRTRSLYAEYRFRDAAMAWTDFCNLFLSAFYLDARKDALYTLAKNDPTRRAAQTVMWECLVRIVRLSSPVISFTADEAWAEMLRGLKAQGSKFELPDSVFLYDLPAIPERWRDERLLPRWELFQAIREKILKGLEEARAAKTIGSSLQARVVYAPQSPEEGALLADLGQETSAELLIVSSFELSKASDAGVVVEKAPGAKCPRCWRIRSDLGQSAKDPALCARCARQLGS